MEELLTIVKESSIRAVRNAVSALSAILENKIRLQSCSLHMVRPEEVLDYIGSTFSSIIGVVSKFRGVVEGYLLLIFDIEHAENLLDRLFKRHLNSSFKDTDNSIKIDALREVGNIIAGNFLSEIGNALRKRVDYSIPEVKADFLPALVDPICIALALKESKVLMLDTDFQLENGDLRLNIIFFLSSSKPSEGSR